MFVVVTLVALFVAYEVDWIRQRHAALLHHGHCLFTPRQRAPGWLGFFGEQGCETIFTSNEKASEIQRLKRLFPESVVYGAAR